MTTVIMLPIVEALVEDEKAGYSSKGTGQAIEVSTTYTSISWHLEGAFYLMEPKSDMAKIYG